MLLTLGKGVRVMGDAALGVVGKGLSEEATCGQRPGWMK